ncbi:hypothetical protein DEO72_LG8g1863 [Vigna unguiculata]|uniref:Uncharacterized protein n=1 Tax=Vigna unguiculata TaxID=3917 RepID=A0A4D6MSS7_VIGUN|nr:hypothetical protein DEO72_LG8g1863 [Vigna unguiculata]
MSALWRHNFTSMFIIALESALWRHNSTSLFIISLMSALWQHNSTSLFIIALASAIHRHVILGQVHNSPTFEFPLLEMRNSEVVISLTTTHPSPRSIMFHLPLPRAPHPMDPFKPRPARSSFHSS